VKPYRGGDHDPGRVGRCDDEGAVQRRTGEVDEKRWTVQSEPSAHQGLPVWRTPHPLGVPIVGALA